MKEALALLRFEKEHMGSREESTEIIIPVKLSSKSSGRPMDYICNDIKMVKELADSVFDKGKKTSPMLQQYGITYDDYPTTWTKCVEYVVRKYGESSGLFTVMEFRDTAPTVIE